MNSSYTAVRLPSGDESIAPVTILDAQGQIIRVVSAAEFRRDRVAGAADTLAGRGGVVPMSTKRALRRAHGRSQSAAGAAGAPQTAMAS
jgi:hypothetical protein